MAKKKKDLPSEMINRRKEMFALVVKNGKPVGDACEKVAEKYGVSPSTVRDDWSRRKEWLPSLFRIKNAATIVFDILAEQQSVKEELWKIATVELATQASRIRALEVISKINQSLIDMLYELGIIELKNEKKKTEIHMTQVNIGELPEERKVGLLKAYAGEYDENDPKSRAIDL